MVGLSDGEKIEDMCNRLHTIPACDIQTDRQTDGRTSCHGIVRAMHTRRAAIIIMKISIILLRSLRLVMIINHTTTKVTDTT